MRSMQGKVSAVAGSQIDRDTSRSVGDVSLCMQARLKEQPTD